MEQLADAKLPGAMGYEWTGISFQEKKVGTPAFYVVMQRISESKRKEKAEAPQASAPEEPSGSQNRG